MTAVVLFDNWRSSASCRMRIALRLAGLAFETLLSGFEQAPFAAVRPHRDVTDRG